MREILIDVNGKQVEKFVEVVIQDGNGSRKSIGKFEVDYDKDGEIDFKKSEKIKIAGLLFKDGFVSGIKDSRTHKGALLGTGFDILFGERDIRTLINGYLRGVLAGGITGGTIQVIVNDISVK